MADPLRFWTHDSAYAGSQACKGCHAEIYQRQQASNHSRSLRPAKEVPQLTSGLPIERRDRASDSTLLLQLDSDGEVQLQSRRNSDQAAAVLEWAFGSGLKGITPIARTGDGHLVESRLTWYASLQDISFTTGSSKYDPATARESLGRRLTQKQVSECFGCHTTGYDRAREAPARDEMGVSCERCHGPGSEHIAAVQNAQPPKKIFHPGRMEGFPQIQMCGACHGRPPQDNDFDALRLLENTPHSVRFPSQRIVLSRCFNESFGELKCTTCHDPHVDVADEAAGYDAACQSCHDAESRKEAAVFAPLATPSVRVAICPKERVMRHSLFSDHWIRVVNRGGG